MICLIKSLLITLKTLIKISIPFQSLTPCEFTESRNQEHFQKFKKNTLCSFVFFFTEYVLMRFSRMSSLCAHYIINSLKTRVNCIHICSQFLVTSIIQKFFNNCWLTTILINLAPNMFVQFNWPTHIKRGLVTESWGFFFVVVVVVQITYVRKHCMPKKA